MRGKGQVKHLIPQANKLVSWLCVGINIGELGRAKSQPIPLTKRSVWFTLQNGNLKCHRQEKQNPCACNTELTLCPCKQTTDQWSESFVPHFLHCQGMVIHTRKEVVLSILQLFTTFSVMLENKDCCTGVSEIDVIEIDRHLINRPFVNCKIQALLLLIIHKYYKSVALEFRNWMEKNITEAWLGCLFPSSVLWSHPRGYGSEFVWGLCLLDGWEVQIITTRSQDNRRSRDWAPQLLAGHQIHQGLPLPAPAWRYEVHLAPATTLSSHAEQLWWASFIVLWWKWFM